MKKLLNSTQANDWFFYFHDSDKVIYYRVAVWATYDDGSVIGLLSAEKKDNDFSLVTPPLSECSGYVHWMDLNAEEKIKASNRCDKSSL